VIAGAGANTLSIPVVLIIRSSPAPAISGIRDGAAFATDRFSPGSIISIFGSQLGPDPYVNFTIEPGTPIATTLGGVTVTVDGSPAIPLLASSQQVNAVIPFSAKTSGEADVVVTYNGLASSPFQIPMSAAAFKLFAANAQGAGPAAALNQNFSVNTADHPAAKGSVIQLFGTGGGAVNPAGTDGALAPSKPLPSLTASYSATVNGKPATVLYAGAAPGLVFGVYQVNVQLPSDVTSGPADINIEVGDSESQTGITVFVQ
jgi:uncharacterized protein (TIGR03437 family)